jgi:hypothetical protein
MDPYNKTLHFNRTETAEEVEEIEKITLITQQDYQADLISQTDAIRMNGKKVQPEGLPPVFNPFRPLSDDTSCVSTGDPKAPKVTFISNDHPASIIACLDLLLNAVRRLFIQAQSLYIAQRTFNDKAERLALLAKKADLHDSANKTAKQLLTKPGGAKDPILAENIRKGILKETTDSKRKLQSLSSQVENERAQRIKLQKEIAALKAKQKRSNREGAEPGAQERKEGTQPTPATKQRKLNPKTSPRPKKNDQSQKSHGNQRGKATPRGAGDAKQGTLSAEQRKQTNPSASRSNKSKSKKWRRVDNDTPL